MKQIINETQSFDDLFIQGFKLCIKAENLIIDAIVHAGKPFELTGVDNTDINAITDNISKESINNADEIIQRINEINASAKLNIEGSISPQFTNYNEVNLLFQLSLQSIQDIKQRLNNEVLNKIMKQIDDNLGKFIIDKQNELNDAEEKLTDLYNKMMKKEMEQEQEFNLVLEFVKINTDKESTIKLENVKIGEIFQRIKASSPYFPHSAGLINQYVEKMKRLKLNETDEFIVPDMKLKMKNYYKLISTRIK